MMNDDKIFEKISFFKDIISEAKKKIDSVYKTLDEIENKEKAANSNELSRLEKESKFF